MQSACTVLYCHLWPVWLYHIFPHYLINYTILGKKLLNIKCVFWFSLQLLPETFFILRRIQRDFSINLHRSSCKVPVIVVRFYLTRLNFFTDFRKILKYQLSWKSFQWEPSCSMRTDRQTDRQTDMTKLMVAFRNFAKASKKLIFLVVTRLSVVWDMETNFLSNTHMIKL
jgi:hypothetical protein